MIAKVIDQIQSRKKNNSKITFTFHQLFYRMLILFVMLQIWS